jgi:hypothetical protein
MQRVQRGLLHRKRLEERARKFLDAAEKCAGYEDEPFDESRMRWAVKLFYQASRMIEAKEN